MYIQAWEYRPGEDVLCHYGKLHRSGRYPWGSGDRPFQRGGGPGRAHASVAEKKRLSKESSGGSRSSKSKHAGLKKAVRAAKKGLIRFDLYPKRLMSDEELNAKIERLKREDLLKNLKGQKTKSEEKKARENRPKVVQPLVNDTLKAMVQQVLIPTVTGFIVYKLKNASYNKNYREDDEKSIDKLKQVTKSFVNMDDDELDYNIKHMEKVKNAIDRFSDFDFNQPSGKKPNLNDEIFSRMKSGGGGGQKKKKGGGN